MHRLPLSVSARSGECRKGGRQVRVAKPSPRQKTKFTTSVQTLVAKRLATVYPHPEYVPRKNRATLFSPASACCQATPATPLNSLPPANLSRYLGAAITNRPSRRAGPDTFLYFVRVEHSVSVYVRLRHF